MDNPISFVWEMKERNRRYSGPVALRDRNTVKDGGRIGARRERGQYYSHSSRKDTSSEHHLWFSPGGYNWSANNNNNMSLWKGELLTAKTTGFSAVYCVTHTQTSRLLSCHGQNYAKIFRNLI